MSFGWWPVSFFFLLYEVVVWLICRDLWILALFPPQLPTELSGVGEMSASCCLQGACSPSHSCASPCQPHLCPLHLAWRCHQMSPNVTSLFQLVRSLFLSLPPLSPHTLLNNVHSPRCDTATSWSHWQPHSLCGPAIVCVSQCTCLMLEQAGLSLFSFPPLPLSQEWGSTHPFLSLTWLTT